MKKKLCEVEQMLQSRIVSSLEKCFPEQLPESFAPLKVQKVLSGERVSFQLLLRYAPEVRNAEIRVKIDVKTDLPLVAREVVLVPNTLPVFAGRADDNYLKKEPGIYPDLLTPAAYGDLYALAPDMTHSVWFDFDVEQISVGTHPVTLCVLTESGKELARETIDIVSIDKALPPLDLKFTQWFHCDCLADYYRVKVFGDEHFKIIENFARAARREGVNMILTPIHTPPLDTAVGGERTTTQLVRITRANGKYAFDFTLFDRFVTLMDSLGFEYFEMAHFFTQWGAERAPKIVLTREDGTEEKIFGWETDATGEAYVNFLNAYIPALLSHIEEIGIGKRVYFHISDEPTYENYQTYLAAKAVVRDLLSGYPIMDASSTYDFYREGIVDIAIPANNRIAPYLENKVEGLWTYYCCSQTVNVANNLIAMPAYRTRTLAYQMYKYHIVGFLQWGFNFYNTRYSIGKVNPYLDTTGGRWVPGGDPFVVYPAPDGTPYESTRLLTFRETLDEVRLCRLVEEKIGYEATVALIESYLGEVAFDRCATTSASILTLHNALIDQL